MSNQTAEPPYNRDAIYLEAGPFDPRFIDEAICTIMCATPIETNEPQRRTDRRLHCVLRGLAALHPRDEPEIMLGVQALSAYHAAAACWHIGMNARQPRGESTRHITTAATAARTFDSMLRALERRQAKPLAIPIGRPEPREWRETDIQQQAREWEGRCELAEDDPPPAKIWTPQEVALAEEIRERQRIETENEGLDIANTEGILPGGGMILPENPTPNQLDYMERRLKLMYRREIAENRRKGITAKIRIRPIRTGDLIP